MVFVAAFIVLTWGGMAALRKRKGSAQIMTLTVLLLLYFSVIAIISANQFNEFDQSSEGDQGAEQGQMPDNLQSSSVVTISIEHSVNGLTFSPRSKFSINLGNGKSQSLEPEKNVISVEFMVEFRELVSHGQLYRIRTHSQIGNDSSPYVVASLPVCELLKSGFKEDITFQLDSSSNYVIGISYSSPVIAISRPCDSTKIKAPMTIHSKLKVGELLMAQTIAIQAVGARPQFLQKVLLGTEDEKAAGAGGAGAAQANQSFLVKYWYIVVPMMIFMLLPSSEDKAKAGAGTAAAQ